MEKIVLKNNKTGLKVFINGVPKLENIHNENIGESLAYMMKYIEKTGEKIVYSKDLPQYFITDILEDDVVCNIGLEDRKLLLFDDFSCWKAGEYMGTVSPEVIKQMLTANV